MLEELPKGSVRRPMEEVDLIEAAIRMCADVTFNLSVFWYEGRTYFRQPDGSYEYVEGIVEI
jgi:hypothetical protein